VAQNPPWQPGKAVFVEGRRVLLRSLTPEDLTPRFLAWHDDPEVSAHLWHPPVPAELYWRALLEARDERRCFLLGVEHVKSGLLVGYIKLVSDADGRVMASTTVIGDKAFWHGKLGLEAAHIAQRFVFAHLPIEAIERRVYADNESLLARYRRQGLAEIGSHDEAAPSGNGAVRRVHVFHHGRALWLEHAAEVDAQLAELPDVEVRWQPGMPVRCETRRLVVRSLALRDVTPEVATWLADDAVAQNVWHPAMAPEAFFRGLIKASDQKTRFAFAIVHKQTNRLIGYAKLAIDVARRVQVPTVVLGERAYWSGELGTEAVRAIQRFGFEHLPVDAIESRVYAENVKVRERLLRFGYEEQETQEERAPGAARARRVHVYRITREAWYARYEATEARIAALPDVSPND
jgi:RimJ/RimL family protein N-acetyltransferase